MFWLHLQLILDCPCAFHPSQDVIIGPARREDLCDCEEEAEPANQGSPPSQWNVRRGEEGNQEDTLSGRKEGCEGTYVDILLTFHRVEFLELPPERIVVSRPHGPSSGR